MQWNERLLLLKDRVCAGDEAGRYGETQCFRGLEVNDEPVFVRFHYRQIARLLAPEYSGGIDTGLAAPERMTGGTAARWGSCLEVGVLQPLDPQDAAPARHPRSINLLLSFLLIRAAFSRGSGFVQ
jgi:hypothetical protein